MTGGSKLGLRGVECQLLGYAGGHGNYKVQDIESFRVFVSRDVIFEEGHPHRMSPSVGENHISLFDIETGVRTLDETVGCQTDQQNNEAISEGHAESDDQHVDRVDIQMEPIQPEIRHSSRITKPSTGILQSREY